MCFTIQTALTHYSTHLTEVFTQWLTQKKLAVFPLMLANDVIYLSTSNSDGKRAEDTFIMLLTFNINPLQESVHAGLRVKPGPPEDTICCFLFSCTQRRQLWLQQSMRRLQVWQCSVLFTGRLLHLTFTVAPGGRELHANAIEAFSASSLRPPCLGVITSLFTLR